MCPLNRYEAAPVRRSLPLWLPKGASALGSPQRGFLTVSAHDVTWPGAVRRKSAGGSRVARALGSHACCSDTGSGDLRYLLALLDRLVRGTSETRRGRSALAACAGAPKVANLPIVQPGPRARVESENY